MSRTLPRLVLALALLAWAPPSQVVAEHQPCEDGTLIYWQEMHYWVCMDYVAAGPACILCYGDPIDVVG